jgi:hypothetical protein
MNMRSIAAIEVFYAMYGHKRHRKHKKYLDCYFLNSGEFSIKGNDIEINGAFPFSPVGTIDHSPLL